MAIVLAGCNDVSVDINVIDFIAGERTSTMQHVSRGFTLSIMLLR
jgi:hypothetical protein